MNPVLVLDPSIFGKKFDWQFLLDSSSEENSAGKKVWISILSDIYNYMSLGALLLQSGIGVMERLTLPLHVP